HLLDKRLGKLQLALVDFLVVELRHFANLSHFLWVTKLENDQPFVLWGDRDEVFAIAKHNLAESDFAGIFQHLAQQRVGLGPDFAIGTDKVRRVVEHRRNLRLVHEANNVDDLGSLQLHFGDIIGLKDRVLIFSVLVALDDVIFGDDLIALLASLVVGDGAIVILVKLVEVYLFRRFDRIVDANRDGY